MHVPLILDSSNWTGRNPVSSGSNSRIGCCYVFRDELESVQRNSKNIAAWLRSQKSNVGLDVRFLVSGNGIAYRIIAKSASKCGIEVSDLGTDDGAKAHRLLSDVGHLVFRFLTKILHNTFTIWFFTRISGTHFLCLAQYFILQQSLFNVLCQGYHYHRLSPIPPVCPKQGGLVLTVCLDHGRRIRTSVLCE